MKFLLKISLSLLSMTFFNLSHGQSYDNFYGNNSFYQNDSQSSYSNQGNRRFPSQTNQYNSDEYNNSRGNASNSPYNGYNDYSSSSRQKYHDGNSPQMFDWDFHESWRDNRDAFYSGETQAEAYRKDHPYNGEGGIGYDGDPAYLKMKNDYERLKIQSDQYVAENNRLANRDPGENQEYYSRGGGGSSQKGKASREGRQRGGNPQDYRSNSQDNYRYNLNPRNNEYQW